MAQAHAGKHTVVTHEIPSVSTRKIQIPDACIGLDVKCMTPYDMLRRERGKMGEKWGRLTRFHFLSLAEHRVTNFESGR